MRGHPLRVLTCGLALVALPAASAAESDAPPRLELTIVDPGVLHVGERRGIELSVRIEPDSGEPLLITPISEGAAVEVVRGRLFRSDATDPEASELRLHVPVAVRDEGTSVLRVEALGYTCTPRCRALRTSASAVLSVRPGQ